MLVILIACAGATLPMSTVRISEGRSDAHVYVGGSEACVYVAGGGGGKGARSVGSPASHVGQLRCVDATWLGMSVV